MRSRRRPRWGTNPMSRKRSSRCLGLAVSLAIALSTTAPAEAGSENDSKYNSSVVIITFGMMGQLSADAPTGSSEAASTSIARAGVYRLDDYNDTANEPGEPTFGGLMKKTVWAKLTLPQSQRVVVHTFGSDFDTALAAYTGNAVNALTLVRGNDDRVVTGFGNNTQSLIQFNATANTKYSIQIGSKNNVDGSIYAGVFVFPPAGGLSAFMAKVGGNAWNSRDYVCNDAHVITCGNPLFILHNSTNKVLTVTASSNLGAGVVAPAQFTIGPNQIKTAQFTFTAAFNKTTTRTVAGYFTFVGKEGAVEITRAQHRALIVVGNAPLGSVLRASVSPAIRAAAINEVKPFDVVLRNSGAQTAIGCHARHDFSYSARLKVTWRRFDPSSGNYIGLLDQPFNLAAGQSASMRVFVASQQTQLADPEFPTPVTLDCANTNPAPINLFNTFDLTALGLYRPAQVDANKLAPAGDTLNVPATGTAPVRFSVINRSGAANFRAVALYIRPIADWSNPNKQFTVTICRLTSANGTCVAPPSPTNNSIEFNAAQNATTFFKIFVKAPSVNPGYAPGLRRVFLKIWQDSPVPLGTFDAPVAAESVAVRKN